MAEIRNNKKQKQIVKQQRSEKFLKQLLQESVKLHQNLEFEDISDICAKSDGKVELEANGTVQTFST